MSKRKAEAMESIDWENEPCPLCTRETLPKEPKIEWIACESRECGKWFHCLCVGASAQTVSAFYCEECSRLGRGTTQRRIERPKRAGILGIDYTALDAGEHVNSLRHSYSSLIESRPFSKATIRVLEGAQLNKKYLDEFGFTEPIVVHDSSELGMAIPANLTVDQVSEAVGPDTHIEVMDVPTQGEDKGWTLGKWASYYNDESPTRVRNVISLEITDSDLGRSIVRPRIVRQLDLLNNFWPRSLFATGDMPKVQTYCLMSLQNSYTDFHIDFAGTSVYYHIIQGSKTFLFIPPTPTNLKKYSDWCLSSLQSKTFLADECKETFKVELHRGDTMMIPPGWIHAVHTPTKSLVIGGNFLHLHGLQKHLEVAEVEERTKVPGKFRFPQFDRTLWFSAIGILAQRPRLCEFELLGLLKLAAYLYSQAVADSEKGHRKTVAEDIPRSHIAGDPTLLARLLYTYAQAQLPPNTADDGEMYQMKTADYQSRILLVKTDLSLQTYERLISTSIAQEGSKNVMTTIGDETFVETWMQLPLSPMEVPQIFSDSPEARGHYRDAKQDKPDIAPTMAPVKAEVSTMYHDNNYIPPIMTFAPAPDSPPGLHTLSASPSMDANKNSTTCFRCKTRKRRCDKERPCKSCIEAGLEKSCLDSGSYAGMTTTATMPYGMDDIPAVPSNNQTSGPSSPTSAQKMVKPKSATKPVLPKVKKLRKPGARCGRCAKDKKQCGREEPICDRCQKKGLDPAECIYPHQVSKSESNKTDTVPTGTEMQYNSLLPEESLAHDFGADASGTNGSIAKTAFQPQISALPETDESSTIAQKSEVPNSSTINA